jgi:radical SAM superfamily enzyme YgiQ (UPF0313 family)
MEDVRRDVNEAVRWARDARRIFLCDGDALVIPQKRLVPLLDLLNASFPLLERIGIYANARSVLLKSVGDLAALRERKLGIIYYGVESGDNEVLKRVRKGACRDRLLAAGRRVREAGILLSVTVLLGIAGVEGSRQHAVETAKLLSDMDPEYAGALTVMVVPGTPLHDEMVRGEFRLPDSFQLIEELGLMIAHSNFSHCFFTSNHASNYLPIRVHLPEQKEEALRLIRQVLSRRDPSALRPEFLRAL